MQWAGSIYRFLSPSILIARLEVASQTLLVREYLQYVTKEHHRLLKNTERWVYQVL